TAPGSRCARRPGSCWPTPTQRPCATPTRTPSPPWPGCSARPSGRCWSSAPASWPTRARSRAAPRRRAAALALPGVANGQGRGILGPGGDGPLVTRARSLAFGAADLVLVAGAPLDFRLGYGSFGGRHGGPSAKVVHLVDAPGQVGRHRDVARGVARE